MLFNLPTRLERKLDESEMFPWAKREINKENGNRKSSYIKNKENTAEIPYNMEGGLGGRDVESHDRLKRLGILKKKVYCQPPVFGGIVNCLDGFRIFFVR